MSEDTEAKPAAKTKDKSAAKKGKNEAKKKGKGGKAQAGGGASDGAVMLSVASHPRARAQVRQAKGWGGLGAFGVTAYLSISHGVSLDVAGLRAIVAGAAGYVVAWGCGVMVWRHLMVAELRARVERARKAVEDPAPAVSEQPAQS